MDFGKDHSNTQAFIGSFLHLFQAVITENRTAELSDAPFTQQLLAALRSVEV
jgi:hypothetical protein